MYIVFYLDENPTSTSQEKGVTYQGGRIHHFEKKNVRTMRQIYTAKIKQALLEDHIKVEPIEGPVYMSVGFHFATKTKKKWGTYKDTKPDLDNSVKLLQDVLSDLGFFAVGDQQVASLHLTKWWSDVPQIAISIQKLEEDNDVRGI